MSFTAAIVGCGPRGLDHAIALGEVDGVSLGGVADLAESRRERAEAELGVPAFADVGELLATVRPEIAVVATPHDVRGALVGRIAEADSIRAIVVEKPLALSMDEAERMVAACDRARVLLTVGYQLRFVPHFVALERAIDSGELGSIEFIRALSYGHLLDQGPHLVDAARCLTGGRRVVWAMSQRSSSLTQGEAPGDRDGLIPEIPAWSTHHIALEGGVRCALETGPLHQRSSRFGQGDEEIDDYLDKRLTVVGSRGIAQFVAGGDCRILSEGDEGWRTHPGGIARYVSANRAFHEEVRDSLLHGTPHRTDAHDSLDSLEGLLACVQSAADGDAVVLPLERIGGSPARTVARRADPEISVILPIPDHRGYAEPAVRSWTDGQTFDRGRYEVIVASDGLEEGLDERVKPLLGPDDRLIRSDGAHEIELYDMAAHAARGRFVLMTEPHCIAEPQFLEELLAHLTRTGDVGAVARTVAISENALARGEETLYDESFRVWSQPGHWCKVVLRGFSVERRAFLEVGGFETAYGRFAEFALAAKLHAAGKRLGYASGAAVQHVYTSKFAMLEPHVEDFAAGDLAYRRDYPAEYCERYFGTPTEWVERRVLSKEGARAALKLTLRSLLRPMAWRGSSWRSLLATLRDLSPAALMGPRPALARANISYAMARWRCRLWRFSDARLIRAYRDAYERLTRRARLRYLAELPLERSDSAAASEFELADLPDDRLFGFHGTESVDGTSFRWTSAVAFADIPVAPGAYCVEVDTGGLRDPRHIGLQVFFNGRPIPRSDLNVDSCRIAFPVTPEQFSGNHDQRLGFVSAAFQPSRVAGTPDTRELGLPVSSIEFRRAPTGEG